MVCGVKSVRESAVCNLSRGPVTRGCVRHARPRTASTTSRRHSLRRKARRRMTYREALRIIAAVMHERREECGALPGDRCDMCEQEAEAVRIVRDSIEKMHRKISKKTQPA